MAREGKAQSLHGLGTNPRLVGEAYCKVIWCPLMARMLLTKIFRRTHFNPEAVTVIADELSSSGIVLFSSISLVGSLD